MRRLVGIAITFTVQQLKETPLSPCGNVTRAAKASVIAKKNRYTAYSVGVFHCRLHCGPEKGLQLSLPAHLAPCWESVLSRPKENTK